MSEPTLFTGLLVSRPPRNGRRLRRLGAVAAAGLLHAATGALLIVSPLLMVETVAPQASVAPIGFLQPRRPGPAGGGRPVPPIRQGERAPGARATPPTGARPRQPVRETQPSVVPLAPPPAGDERAISKPAGLPTEQGGGTGDPLGDGESRWGRPDGCRDCADHRPGPGDGGPGGPILSPDHPLITTQPALIEATRALPRYPEAARRARVQGVVILLIVIRTDGTVGRIEALRAPDHRFGFDLAAIEAVKEWRYRPALMQGRPVAVEAIVQVDFTLVR
ncbi:MAG: energy transducer TonB [Candidatus Polarisedimenticolia bacterium]